MRRDHFRTQEIISENIYVLSTAANSKTYHLFWDITLCPTRIHVLLCIACTFANVQLGRAIIIAIGLVFIEV